VQLVETVICIQLCAEHFRHRLESSFLDFN
jgi:hypothetical protein